MFTLSSDKDQRKQECIPVGCVQSAAVAVGGGGGHIPQCILGYVFIAEGKNRFHSNIK